jgi:hypothetical protein
VLIDRIEETVLLPGREATEEEQIMIPDQEPINWVHPKIGITPGTPPVAHLLTNGVTGIDVFTPTHYMRSDDLGKTWTDPVDPEALGHRWHGRGVTEALADMVPQWHQQTEKLLAIGHNVYYWGGMISPDRCKRDFASSYAVLDPITGEWSDWKKPKMPKGFAMAGHCGSGCSQRVDLDNGDILLPVYGTIPPETMQHSVAVLRCEFDGENLRAVQAGNTLTLPYKRGLLEPSIHKHGDRFLMTIRAEDGYMYYSVSDDGLNWEEARRWAWDDGGRIETHTTQQHWVAHSEGLFLAYTRKREDNLDVFRWRSPVLMAQVDTETMTLVRESECVLMRNQGVRLGNHGITHVSEKETWITDSEWGGNNRDVLLTRIYWKKPNRLFEQPVYSNKASKQPSNGQAISASVIDTVSA